MNSKVILRIMKNARDFDTQEIVTGYLLDIQKIRLSPFLPKKE
jgi:hypothetical protein